MIIGCDEPTCDPPPVLLSFPFMTAKTVCVKERLDHMLVARGLVRSRDQASRLIMAGKVLVDGHRVDKQAARISTEAAVEIVEPLYRFVSRAGEKLAAALQAFDVDCSGLTVLDVGASTGGFTDCVLQHGARRVYAVDVGFGQLDWCLRRDPRVEVLERRNIRHLDAACIPEPVGLAVIDVSFISLTIVVPCVMDFLDSRAAWIIALVKPQFEVGKGLVGRGGIVCQESQRQAVVEKMQACAAHLGLQPIGILDSPIPGQKGNREILMGWVLNGWR